MSGDHIAPLVGRSARASISALVVALLASLVWPLTALAHGVAPAGPSLDVLISGWSFDLSVWLPAVAAGVLYWYAVRVVDRAHPTNPVPRWRMWSWMAGLAALILALASPIEHYDTTLFSSHMIQHLLITMVAAPLLVLAAPITLLLRFSRPEVRRKWILPVLHSRVVWVISYPVVAWSLFAAVMWLTHFSPLFDASLENDLLHRFEHVLYLSAALLFWWPVAGADPSPHRMSFPARLLYLGLGMPLSSFLGLVIYSAPNVLYPHYQSIVRDWGWTPMQDQQWAGGIMWAGGDAVFVLALIITVAAWLRHEEREGARVDARLSREKRSAEVAAVASAAVPEIVRQPTTD